MRLFGCMRFAAVLSLALFGRHLGAEEAVTLDNVVSPQRNTPDEPLAESYSLDRAVHFLDSASLDWQQTRKCFTCHTNYTYLMARPAVVPSLPEVYRPVRRRPIARLAAPRRGPRYELVEGPAVAPQAAAHDTVRADLEALVEKRWVEKGPRWDAEVIMAASVLAFNDAATTGRLHDTSRNALDRIWSVQREDGGFDWLHCGWPPFESDDHFGATMAAVGVGAAPDGYAATPAARQGMDKIRQYLRNNPPPTMHHRAMVLWASMYHADILSAAERRDVAKDLLALQRPDGGWGLATLGDWERADGKEQDKESSDGYGTGFVIYVLRQSGVAADDPRIQGGIAWLKTHQRESGRWFTRSLNKDSKHYITHAGTAMAVMALDACGEIP